MALQEPNPPSGSRLLDGFLRKLVNAVRAQKILPGRGYRVKYTSRGIILEIDTPGGGGSSGSNPCPPA